MASVAEFLEGRLHLRVNRDKSAVAPVGERKFLGHRLLRSGRLGIAPESLDRVKHRLRRITKRNRGISLARMIAEVNAFIAGWLTYFRHAQCKTHLQRLDEWLRHRLRCARIKHCKRIKPLVDFLKRQGVPTKRAWMGAASGKGWWRTASSPPVQEAMPIAWFRSQGLVTLTERYLALHTEGNRRGT